MTWTTVILLHVFTAAVITQSDQVPKTALVVKGKECVAIVESAYTDISKGDMDSASKKLKGLENDAEYLAKEAEEKAKETEKVENQYKQKAEESQRKISNLHSQENAKKARKSDLETILANQNKQLSEFKMELSHANDRLNDAKSRLREAKKDQNVRRGVGTGIGTILGTIIFPGVGTLIGAGVGLGAGQIVNEVIDDLDRASRRVEQARIELQSCQSRIDPTKSQISSIEHEIKQLESEIRALSRQRSQCNEEAKRMKEATLFFLRASNYWKEFMQISEHGADRTALLERLINKAKEREDLNFLKKRGSERVVMTFLEAWELVVVKYVEGSDFKFQIPRA